MSTAYASHDTQSRMRADIAQLTRPIHIAIRRHIHTHDPLLDQLRDAATPSSTSNHGPERRRIPGSRPPVRLDAIDTLANVYVGISFWHAKLTLPSPAANHDWQKAVLSTLPDAGQNIAPSIADWLAADIQSWWHTAALASGWRPTDLLKLR